MGELTEVEGYKQLLDVTENIIASLTTEEDIMNKYHKLKKSILAKITIPSNSQSYNSKIVSAYKEITQQILQGITHF